MIKLINWLISAWKVYVSTSAIVFGSDTSVNDASDFKKNDEDKHSRALHAFVHCVLWNLFNFHRNFTQFSNQTS